MKEETGNPDFVYEISCDQMCGQGHWSMRGEIIVESQEEFDTWMATKKSRFYTSFPDLDPNKKVVPPPAAVADSTNKQVAMNQAGK